MATLRTEMLSPDSEDNNLWDDDDDDDDDEDMDHEILHGPVSCLFCAEILQSVDEVFTHCNATHNFDVKQACKTWRLDCIGYIKMINYVRQQKPTSTLLSDVTLPYPWENDSFMQPHDPEDLLLQFDIESVPDNVPSGDAPGDICSDTKYQLAEQRAKLAEEELQRAVEDLEKVRSVMKTLMSEVGTDSTATLTPSVQTLTVAEDEAYFDSYSHFSIHQEMIKDKVRTESYRDLMLKNKNLFAGKVVLDVGCGTGILSMFAVQAGASHVIGVDQSDIIYQAMDIVRENGFSDKITLLKGRVEDVTLPVDKVDIIISEWMGYFLLFESMLDTVLFARDKFLRDGGIVFPDRCTISLIGSGDFGMHDKYVSFWDDVYGFKMSCMKAEVIHEASVELVNPDYCITKPCVIKELDVCRCSVNDLQFVSPFYLTISQGDSLTAVVGYFDIFFERGCDTKVAFSTSPSSKSTHWKQTVFLLEKPIPVKKGEKLEGTITCKKNRKDPRSLIVTMEIAGVKHKYIME